MEGNLPIVVTGGGGKDAVFEVDILPLFFERSVNATKRSVRVNYIGRKSTISSQKIICFSICGISLSTQETEK